MMITRLAALLCLLATVTAGPVDKLTCNAGARLLWETAAWSPGPPIATSTAQLSGGGACTVTTYLPHTVDVLQVDGSLLQLAGSMTAPNGVFLSNNSIIEMISSAVLTSALVSAKTTNGALVIKGGQLNVTAASGALTLQNTQLLSDLSSTGAPVTVDLQGTITFPRRYAALDSIQVQVTAGLTTIVSTTASTYSIDMGSLILAAPLSFAGDCSAGFVVADGGSLLLHGASALISGCLSMSSANQIQLDDATPFAMACNRLTLNNVNIYGENSLWEICTYAAAPPRLYLVGSNSWTVSGYDPQAGISFLGRPALITIVGTLQIRSPSVFISQATFTGTAGPYGSWQSGSLLFVRGDSRLTCMGCVVQGLHVAIPSDFVVYKDGPNVPSFANLVVSLQETGRWIIQDEAAFQSGASMITDAQGSEALAIAEGATLSVYTDLTLDDGTVTVNGTLDMRSSGYKLWVQNIQFSDQATWLAVAADYNPSTANIEASGYAILAGLLTVDTSFFTYKPFVPPVLLMRAARMYGGFSSVQFLGPFADRVEIVFQGPQMWLQTKAKKPTYGVIVGSTIGAIAGTAICVWVVRRCRQVDAEDAAQIADIRRRQQQSVNQQVADRQQLIMDDARSQQQSRSASQLPAEGKRGSGGSAYSSLSEA